jgi:ankyrin repeat protein
MTASLPAHFSFENLRKQAKTLKKEWDAGDAAALQRIRARHPQHANSSDEQLRTVKARLADCQLVLAREAGFDSWRQLKVAAEAANKSLADQFVGLACLCYDDPHFDHRSFHARAHEMLRNNPWLAEATIWSAAAAGNADAVAAMLDRNRELVNQPGPHGWAPLICACYSRVKPVDPEHSTYAAASLLLDRGADANAYTLKGNADKRLDQTAHRFTALAGLFGGGSTGMANQPPHPRWRDLAERLLECGADPADESAIEISQGPITCEKLAILLQQGLTPDARCKQANNAGLSLMGRALANAAINGDEKSVTLLLAHDVRTDEVFRGKTPWQYAVARGHLAIARLLENAGAPTSELSEVDRVVSLCVAGDERGARAMLERNPNLRAEAPKPLVLRAVDGGRIDAVNLVLDLGFDPDVMDEVTAFQSAAGRGDEALVRLLLRRGASLTIREPFYDGTPVEWAEFFDHPHIRHLLLSEGAICIFDALEYDRLDRVPDVLARDPAALNRPFAKCISREPGPQDWQTPLTRMVDRGKTEAVRVLVDHGADVSARHPDGRSLLQLARDKGFHEIARHLEQQGAVE